MLLKLSEWLKKTELLSSPLNGQVVDNNDPKQIGRVKVRIQGVFEDSDANSLPWCYPMNPYGLGGRFNSSGFSVPEVGSKLTIIFPYDNDVYFPFYIGYFQTKITHQLGKFDVNENYPESYGFRDSTGTYFKINKTKKFIELNHVSGTKIMINNEGDLMFEVAGGLHFNVGGEVHIKSGGNNNQDAPRIDLNSGTAAPIFDKKAVTVELNQVASSIMESLDTASIADTITALMQDTSLDQAQVMGVETQSKVVTKEVEKQEKNIIDKTKKTVELMDTQSSVLGDMKNILENPVQGMSLVETFKNKAPAVLESLTGMSGNINSSLLGSVSSLAGGNLSLGDIVSASLQVIPAGVMFQNLSTQFQNPASIVDGLTSNLSGVLSGGAIEIPKNISKVISCINSVVDSIPVIDSENFTIDPTLLNNVSQEFDNTTNQLSTVKSSVLALMP